MLGSIEIQWKNFENVSRLWLWHHVQYDVSDLQCKEFSRVHEQSLHNHGIGGGVFQHYEHSFQSEEVV